MRLLKTIDEIYEEVKDYDLVITNDISLESALNARIDTPRIGPLAMTPMHIAQLLSPSRLKETPLKDIELVAMLHEITNLELRYIYSEIKNIRKIHKYTEYVRDHLVSNRSREIYDDFVATPTLDKVMTNFDPDKHDFFVGKKVAVIQPEFFNNLDRQFNLPSADPIDIFKTGKYEIPTIYECGNDRQLAENAVSLIGSENPEDFAIVLNSSSPIADAVRSALYRRNLPFVNKMSVRDLATIRDFLSFLTLSFSYDTVRIKHVKELFAAYNGFFNAGIEEFLLCRQSDEALRNRAVILKNLMRDVCYNGLTFGQVRDVFCMEKTRLHVTVLLRDLRLEDKVVTPTELANLKYAVENLADLTNIEQTPENERSGVLIADCTNSVFIDRPVIIYLGMEQDWNITVVGKRYLDAELESELNSEKLEALLQQGQRRIYMVNSSKKGKKPRPTLRFDLIFRKSCDTFDKICDNIVVGRWASSTAPVMPVKGSCTVDPGKEFNEAFSKSSFNNYFFCPRKFMFGRLLRDSENDSIMLGNLIHNFAEFYACHPEMVRELGLDKFVDIAAEKYSGLSSPLMESLDREKIELGLRSIMMFLDSIRAAGIPLDFKGQKRHPNMLFEEFGAEGYGTACETNYDSQKHAVHGEFDLFWNGTISDYKTGRPKDAKTIASAMDLSGTSEWPEFQPLIYLGIATEIFGEECTGEFRQFYVFDNDTAICSGEAPISDNIRTVRITDAELLDAIAESPEFMDELTDMLSKDYREHAGTVIECIKISGGKDPDLWKSSEDLILNLLNRMGKNDNATNRKGASGAIGKVKSLICGEIAICGTTIIIPRGYLDRFLDELDRAHAEMQSFSNTDYPARPRSVCTHCGYREVCTKINEDAQEDGSDE